MVLAPAPVGVNLLVLAAATALLDVKVVFLFGQVHDPSTAIAPHYSQMAAVNIHLHTVTITEGMPKG